MKYLLFISFNNGLLHNCIYDSLNDICESIRQLIEDEGLNANKEKIPTIRGLRKHLRIQDDYIGQLTNGTWYHIQLHPVFGLPTTNINKKRKNYYDF